jgi:hypothetical protein
MFATVNLNIFCFSILCLKYKITVYFFVPKSWEVRGDEEIEITGNSVNTLLEQKLLKHSKEEGHTRDQKHVFFFRNRIREEKSWKT